MTETRPGAAWVHRPWLDLLVGCGGWSAPLLLVSYLLVEEDARRWSAVFYGLALVCNYPHYMATLHRAYGRRDDRARHRLFTHYITGALFVAAVFAHVQLALLAWLFTAYVMWSPWHYTGQNFGLSMMFLRRAGLTVAPRERQWLHVAFVASYVMLLAAFNEGVSRDTLVLSLGLPRAVSLTIQIGAALVFLIAGGLAFRSLATRAGAGLRALAPPLTLFCTQALWFVVPVALTWAAAAPTPQTRYSTGILAIMHSAQYLWITQHFARRDAIGANAWSGWRYWATLIVGGVALFLPGPWLASYAGGVDFTSSMLIVTAVVNIHHFLLDGVVWKLRDPRVARVLVTSDDAAAADARANAALTPTPWWRGRWAVVTLRVSAALALVALAAVDQWRYLLALGGSDRASLERARDLNPYDSAVHLRLAGVARKSGDADAEERALRQAIVLNPQSPVPYHALERFLIESGRLQDAYAHCRLLLEKWPREAGTLVNAGILAQRLGDLAAAEEWWRRALAVDPSLAEVHLYLAEMLDGRGRVTDAVPHYQGYLELVVRQRDEQRHAPRRVALAVVKFADALARTGQADLARRQYDLAARIAQQRGIGDVEAEARDRLRALASQ